MESLGLMDRFEDPALFEQLTGMEKLQGALITTLMGMGLTFLVLALLWLVIVVISKILYKAPTAAALAPGSATLVNAVAAQAKVLDSKEGALMDDKQLIAVITAAITAAHGREFKSNLVVRKINRITGSNPAWRNAGQNETIDSRRI